MGKSTDLRGLQPGGTYQVQIVPKGSDPSDRNGSFVTTFTVPTTDVNGAQLSTVNKSLKTVISSSVVQNPDGSLTSSGGQLLIANSVVPQVQVGTAILPASSAKPVKIAAGSYYILGGITFNTPFSDLPHIVVSLTSTPGGSSNLVPRIYKVSKNQFSAIIYNVGTTTATLVKNVGVGYIAAVNNFSPNTPSAIDSSLVVSSLTAAIMPDSTSALYHINVDWPTTNAAYYVLDRSPVSNFSSGVFSASIFQPLSSYIDTLNAISLDPVSYFYRVGTASVDVTLGSPYSGSIVTASAGTTAASITWTQRISDSNPISYYQVYYGTSNPFSYSKIFNGIETSPSVVSGITYVTCQAEVTGINASGTYKFIVDTVNAFGESINNSTPMASVTLSIAGIPGGVIGSNVFPSIYSNNSGISTSASSINFIGTGISASSPASGSVEIYIVSGSGGSGGTSPGTGTASANLFSLDFSDPLTSSTNWTVQTGTWTASSGNLEQTDTSGNAKRIRAAVATMSPVSNIEVEVQYITGTGGLQRFGIGGYYNGVDSSAPLVYIESTDSAATWHLNMERDALSYVLRNYALAGFTASAWNKITVKFSSESTLSIYINDIYQTTVVAPGQAPNNSYGSPYPYLYSYGTDSKFRNFKLWDLNTGSIAVTGVGNFPISINTVSSNYTLALADGQNAVEVNGASTVTITIPAASTVSFPVGTETYITGMSSSVTITPAPGVTLNYYSPTTSASCKIIGQYGEVSLLKRATDAWIAFGNIA